MSNDGHKPRRSGSKNDGNKEKTPKVHETKIASKEVAEKIYKDQVKRVLETNKIKLRNGRKDIESPVYTPNLTEIESSLKELEKASKEYATCDYACNNINIFLQETLKRVKLSSN